MEQLVENSVERSVELLAQKSVEKPVEPLAQKSVKNQHKYWHTNRWTNQWKKTVEQ